MKQHDLELAGTITDVFAHRFVLETDKGRVLADLGPKGAERFTLKPGQKVRLAGERKPSEVKVSRIAAEGGAEILLEHGPGQKGPKGPKHDGPKHDGPKHHDPKHHGPDHHDHHEPADPAIAIESAKAAGYTPLGEPRRKPKHFDLHARRPDGEEVDLHINIDGTIGKEKPPKH